MGPDFVRQHAPLLALPPRDGAKERVVPEVGPGLTPPEHMYSEQTNMPLPYLQQEGGQREFFVPEGETATGLTPILPPVQGLRGLSTPEPLPAVTPEAPTNLLSEPVQGLRGRGPGGGETVPRGRIGVYNMGRSATSDIPRAPVAGGGQGVTYPGQRVRVPLISRDAAEEQIMANVDRGASLHAAESIRGRQTLGDLMRSMNFQLPNISLQSPGQKRTTPRRQAQNSYIIEDGVVPREQFDSSPAGVVDWARAIDNERRLEEQANPARPQ